MSILDGPGEGTWSVFAQKAVEERDEARSLLIGLISRLHEDGGQAAISSRRLSEAAQEADLVIDALLAIKDERDILLDQLAQARETLVLFAKAMDAGEKLINRGSEAAMVATNILERAHILAGIPWQDGPDSLLDWIREQAKRGNK